MIFNKAVDALSGWMCARTAWITSIATNDERLILGQALYRKVLEVGPGHSTVRKIVLVQVVLGGQLVTQVKYVFHIFPAHQNVKLGVMQFWINLT